MALLVKCKCASGSYTSKIAQINPLKEAGYKTKKISELVCVIKSEWWCLHHRMENNGKPPMPRTYGHPQKTSVRVLNVVKESVIPLNTLPYSQPS